MSDTMLRTLVKSSANAVTKRLLDGLITPAQYVKGISHARIPEFGLTSLTHLESAATSAQNMVGYRNRLKELTGSFPSGLNPKQVLGDVRGMTMSKPLYNPDLHNVPGLKRSEWGMVQQNALQNADVLPQSARKMFNPSIVPEKKYGGMFFRSSDNAIHMGSNVELKYPRSHPQVDNQNGINSILSHELGHAQSYFRRVNNPQAESLYDRLLLHKTRKHAPEMYKSFMVNDMYSSPGQNAYTVGKSSLLEEMRAQHIASSGGTPAAKNLIKETGRGWKTNLPNESILKKEQPALLSTLQHLQRNYSQPGGQPSLVGKTMFPLRKGIQTIRDNYFQ